MRLIDADELKIDYSFTWDDITPTHEELYELIDRQPTIEERKKGKWIAKEERQKQEIFICSVCKGWAYSPWIGSRKSPKPNRCKYNYCPNCGSYNGVADMRGET